ncbi:MAG: acetyl-CoA synthase subunit delta, partial [Candidatus Methanoperedens sp.]|nr:acetyl-CoA synthase subunit delta [Candidatus Methanoperedens sp.]
MTKKIKLSELGSLFGGDIQALEGVKIEGDVEIDLGQMGMNPQMAYALGHETAQLALHLMNISRILGYPVDQVLGAAPAKPARLSKLIESRFSVGKIEEWKTPIQEVVLGATSYDGGTRKSTIKLGGETALPYYFDGPMPHRNHITMDVFDMP